MSMRIHKSAHNRIRPAGGAAPRPTRTRREDANRSSNYEFAIHRVDVPLAVTRPAALAAQRATARIPIVLVLVSEPMEAGLVESIRRPGGTISGIALNFQYTAAKRLQLFMEAFGLYPFPVRDQAI